MHTASLAHSAYARASSIAPLSRDTEYRAFSQVTRRMAAALPVTPQSFPRLADALHQNQRLWRILAADVAGEDNDLPEQLRAQIFYLYEFTVQHTRKVLRNEADADMLIELNTTIMRGLRHGEGEAPA